jgi:hypothetical protein
MGPTAWCLLRHFGREEGRDYELLQAAAPGLVLGRQCATERMNGDIATERDRKARTL